MTTVDNRSAEPVTDVWLAALKFTAGHRAAEFLRSLSGDPVILAVADAMEQIKAQGMTAEDCYNLAGLDKVRGPYMNPAVAVYTAAAYMTAGWSSARLPDATRPEVAEAVSFLESLGVTPVEAARIAETGSISISAPSPRAVTEIDPRHPVLVTRGEAA